MASLAVIIGSSQGIGLQLARIYLSQTNLHVVALSRNSKAARDAILDTSASLPFRVPKDASAGFSSSNVFSQITSKDALVSGRLITLDTDVKDEASIERASEQVKSAFGKDSIRLILNVAGKLQPERKLDQVIYEQMLAQFQLNTFAPLLTLKHFMPLLHTRQTLEGATEDPSHGLLPAQTNIIGNLSARVGSISDNRLGGWYSYRSSKAAQNQITRSIALDLAKRKQSTICVGLHPGTVRTALSQEFTGGPGGDVKNGGQDEAEERRKKGEFEADESASLLAAVLRKLKEEDSGFVYDYSGSKVPF